MECPVFEPQVRLAPSDDDPVLARVNGRPLVASQVVRQVEKTGLGVREALETLIDEELLVQEAERRDLHRDPEALQQAKQAAIYALLRGTFEREFTPGSVPTEDLRKLYDLNARAHFQRPEIRQFAHIAAPRPWQRRGRRWHLDQQADRRLRKAFGDLRSEILASAPKTWQEFEAFATGELAKELKVFSERGTKARDELQKPFADALFSLKGPGDISEVIATRQHLHVAFLVETFPGTNIPFTEARQGILERHFPDAQQAAFRRLIQEAKARCSYRIRPEHLPVGIAEAPE